MAHTRTTLILILAIGLLMAACNSFIGGNEISYNQDIRPIFNAKCLSCHGGVKKSGGFSLLFREDAMGEMESGKAAIVPGKHNESELYKRLVHHDPEERMPQESEPLSPEQIKLVARWIDEGAKWEDHWAYVAPQAQEIPTRDSEWPQVEFDHFLLARMEAEQLTPAAEADKRTLIRRASLDLTGIPPTPEAVARFLADESEDAYATVIDDLLASSQYGEKWAAMWLDLARYADSKGYEKDPHRNIWRYRDWVIQAFNQDMPFDQFTREQLAGDLLPDPTQDQLIATAFHRNSMTNTEGGTEDEEFRIVAIQDRVATTFDIWQSTTIGCVQCHSHPYDPFRHKEYYELMAIFNNTQDNDLNDERPNLEIFTPEDEASIRETLQFIQQLEPSKVIDPKSSLTEQTKQAIFPRLRALDCDEFHNVIFFGGVLSNWSNNAQAGIGKQYYFRYDNIPIEDLQSISVEYTAKGSGARAEIRLDHVNGPLIGETDFPKTQPDNGWKFQQVRVQLDRKVLEKAQPGPHHLVIELINTVQKIPEGSVNIREFGLNYANQGRESAQLTRHRETLVELRNKADKTPIMQERDTSFSRKMHVFERGNFLVKGDEVRPDVPGILPPLSEESPRLALANWLVSPENPLTARVMVNRFWEQLFGTGIVPTLEDFGTQGEKPTHPELLDYLALRFMEEHKWSMKQLLREILLSATYRQAAIVTPEKQEKDPYNLLLARGPRFRLSAEQIRDQALAVSGLLHDSLGGPSVMPPQPDGIWQVVYSGDSWKTATGKQAHRRGVYTYWRRTTPYPSMVAFDSPSREFCVSRRIRTNTPLQALVTLNDPVYLEAARSLAKRMQEAGGPDLAKSISAGYEFALCQAPNSEVIEILTQLYHQSESELKSQGETVIPISNKPETVTYASTSEPFTLADPMTVVANAILNLDGFVMKE